MADAYCGIDLAFAKRKRLPVVVCVSRNGVLLPLPLRNAICKPPLGQGNKAILDAATVAAFADEVCAYLAAVESEFEVKIRRVAIDAPSSPKAVGTKRRKCEIALDVRKISCITTPSHGEFALLCDKARDHLAGCGLESTMPGANQLWMLVGFALFESLRRSQRETIEVFPQAIAAMLKANQVHKSNAAGLGVQLQAVSRFTQWPTISEPARLKLISYGAMHDRLDAYMAAWIASLPETDREALGCPPDDAIWVPRLPTENVNCEVLMADRYRTYADLQAHEPPGSFAIRFRNVGSPVAVVAPHGGGIEEGTSELADATAADDLSVYIFEGLKPKGNRDLHITSTRFDEPQCAEIVRASETVVAIHGEGSDEEVVFVGGRGAAMAEQLRSALESRGFAVRQHKNPALQGTDINNVCNRGRRGAGVQLEISRGLRMSFFEEQDLSRDGRERRTIRFHDFVDAVRAGIQARDTSPR